MSAHPGLAGVLTRTDEALTSILADRQTTASKLGRIVGAAHTTISRRGAEAAGWPLRDGILLAAHYPVLRVALSGWERQEPAGQALLAETCARQAITAMAAQIGAINTRLESGGVIDRREAAVTDRELAALEERIATLRVHLQAKAKGAHRG